MCQYNLNLFNNKNEATSNITYVSCVVLVFNRKIIKSYTAMRAQSFIFSTVKNKSNWLLRMKYLSAISFQSGKSIIAKNPLQTKWWIHNSNVILSIVLFLKFVSKDQNWIFFL